MRATRSTEVVERVDSLARGDRYLIEMDIMPPPGDLTPPGGIPEVPP